MNVINSLLLLLCLTGGMAHADSVTPYSPPSAIPKPIKDIRDINGSNVQTFLKHSAPVMPLKVEPAPSPIATLHNGPAIFLTLGVPAELAHMVRRSEQTQPSAQAEDRKIKFSDEDAPTKVKPVTVAAINNPLLQNAASMSNAMPPAVWLLGFGLLGMAGISRRRKKPR
jgi:hypothetical protein